MSGEIEQILNIDAETVVIGGNEQIKKAMFQILKYISKKKVVALDEDIVNNSTAIGAITIFENRLM